MKLEDRVRKVLAGYLEIGEDQVGTEESFAEMGLDSLDYVGVVMALEDEFEIEIPDDDVEGCVTVGMLVKYLQGRELA